MALVTYTIILARADVINEGDPRPKKTLHDVYLSLKEDADAGLLKWQPSGVSIFVKSLYMAANNTEIRMTFEIEEEEWLQLAAATPVSSFSTS